MTTVAIPMTSGVVNDLRAAGFGIDLGAAESMTAVDCTLPAGWMSASNQDESWTHLRDPHGRTRFKICHKPNTKLATEADGGIAAPNPDPYTVVIAPEVYLRDAVTAGTTIVLDQWIRPADAATMLDQLAARLDTDLATARRYLHEATGDSRDFWAGRARELPRQIDRARQLADTYQVAATLPDTAAAPATTGGGQ